MSAAPLSPLAPAVFLRPCDSNTTWKLTEHRDSCEAHCYVVNACWNSQINGRGSRPNQGSIPVYILELWAVVHPGRRQYLLLPWHSDRQDGGSGNHFSTSHLRGDFIPDWGNSPFFSVGSPLWDCCFLERGLKVTGRDVHRRDCVLESVVQLTVKIKEIKNVRLKPD